MVVFGKSSCILTEVVVFGAKLRYSGKSGSIQAKWLYLGKSGCFRAKLVVFKIK